MNGTSDFDTGELLEQAERKAAQQRVQPETQSSNAADFSSDAATAASSYQHRSGVKHEDDHNPVPDHKATRNAAPLSGPPNPINRYSSEREENDQRRSRRSKDLADGDTRGGSDWDSANGNRSRSPYGRPSVDSYRPGAGGDHRRYRSRSPGRLDRPYDDYPRGRGGRNRSRQRSRSPGRRRSPKRQPPTRDDRGRRERSADRNRPGQKSNAPEPTSSLDSDRRTVFVSQLAVSVRSSQLRTFFLQAGDVVETQIVKDRVSQRSKGVGYVEFVKEDSVPKAIALTGHKLNGIPIIVAHTEAEKNRQPSKTENGASASNGVPFHRLYVGNINFNLTEENLRGVFDSFGPLEFVSLVKEEGGRSKGYGFVQYTNADDAKAALTAMNGFELGGRPIRVGLGNDRNSIEATKELLKQFPQAADNPNAQASAQAEAAAKAQGSSFSGAGGRGPSDFQRGGRRETEKYTASTALDDADVSGVHFGNVDRYSLMKKLARIEDTATDPSASLPKKKPVIEKPTPTRCVLVKHAFDAAKNEKAEPYDPNWAKDIETEFKDECIKSYGKVVHIALAADTPDGQVYLKFDTVQSSTRAIQSLNGRHFDGRQLTADFVVDAIYNSKYPRAASL